MKLTNFLLGEFVLLAPEGTFYILRGGIDHVRVKQFPATIPLGIFFRVEAAPHEMGKHKLAIKLMGEKGVMSESALELEVTAQTRRFNQAVQARIEFKEEGQYEFVLLINQEEKGAWGIHVSQEPGAPSSS